jgi:hypothetical protein
VGAIGGSYSPPFAEIAFAIVGLEEILERLFVRQTLVCCPRAFA